MTRREYFDRLVRVIDHLEANGDDQEGDFTDGDFARLFEIAGAIRFMDENQWERWLQR